MRSAHEDAAIDGPNLKEALPRFLIGRGRGDRRVRGVKLFQLPQDESCIIIDVSAD